MVVAVRHLMRAVSLAVVLAACAGQKDDGGALGRRVPSTAERPSNTSGASTTTAPTTTTTSTPTSVTGTSDMVLGPLGLGVIGFGTEAATALAELEARFGPAVDDRPLGSCPSGEVDRLVQFAELSVLISASGATERFVAWDLGAPSEVPSRLTTAEGVGVGTSLTELRAAYGNRLELSPADPFGPGFEVDVDPPGRLGGTLTGTSGSATVATLSGGTASCAL